MLTQDQASEIFSKIQKYSTAEEVEALFYGGHSALTRFANNTIHQNVAEEHYGVSVRTVFGGRTARASTNKLDEESLKRVVRASEDLAKVQQPDPDLLPMPVPGETLAPVMSEMEEAAKAGGGGWTSYKAILPRYFEQTARTTPDERAVAVGVMVAAAKRHSLTAAGIFAISDSIEGIFNSRGVAHWHQQTAADISVTMLAADSSGWQKANSPDVSQLD